jgi:hypothetical protein
MTDQTDDNIYLEPGSVWRRDENWVRLDYFDGYRFSAGCFYGRWSAKPSDWLTWAKHPDTVLVYSPSGNKLPPKPGYVRGF